MKSRGAFGGGALAFAIACGSLAAKPSETYQATAVHLRDGDSLIVSDGERQRELRIGEIDTPERGQPWGRRATQALAQLVEGHALRVEFVELDRWGREVSNVWVGDASVARELVRGGHAWAYRKYLRDEVLLDLEREAREARRGLWSLPAHTFVPPWEWRHGARTVSAEAAVLAGLAPVAPVGLATAPTCGAKRYCKEMSGCAEARFYLEHCGVSRLDRDGDGVACEDLCR